MCSVTGTLCTKSKKNGALFVSHVPLTLSLHRMCFQQFNFWSLFFTISRRIKLNFLFITQNRHYLYFILRPLQLQNDMSIFTHTRSAIYFLKAAAAFLTICVLFFFNNIARNRPKSLVVALFLAAALFLAQADASHLPLMSSVAHALFRDFCRALRPIFTT